MRYGLVHSLPEHVAAVPLARPQAAGELTDIIAQRSRIASIWTPPQYHNGSINGDVTQLPAWNDCVVAALYHAPVLAALALGGVRLPDAPDAEVRATFAAAAGMPGATDEHLAQVPGLDPLPVLQRAVTHGVWLDYQQPAPVVPLVGRVALDRQTIVDAIVSAGCIFGAFNIYEADDAALSAGSTLGAMGDARGALIGGHAMLAHIPPATLNDSAVVGICTYNSAAVTMTLGAFMDRLQAAYALLWEPPVVPALVDMGVDAGAVRAWGAGR